MCGFLFEHSSTSPISKKAFINILNLSINRGPDHQGYWTNGTNIQIGFNRLAILDLSAAGSQPMLSPQKQFIIVFNGEIYNHLELRKELNFANFKGHSDTETITACLEEWGIESTIQKLDGMFALVIYEQSSGTVTLARDFAGIKPLYYGWNGKVLVAASQYDQVVTHPAFADQPVDPQILKLYLQQHFMPAPFGLIKNTFQVEPGKIVQFSKGRKNEKAFWEFPSFYQSEINENDEALECIDAALDKAVQEELLSDVPLGSFLSGGVDSPLVSYYANKYNPGINTFSIGSDSLKHDESESARWYADHINTRHHAIQMNAANTAPLMNEVWSCMHEPMADFGLIPTYLVSNWARKKVKVVLSGDGGDELFFGYERFWSIAKNIPHQHHPWWLKAGLYKLDQLATGNRRINSIVLLKNQGSAHEGLHSRFTTGLIHKVFPDLTGVQLPEQYQVYDYPNSKSEMELVQHMRKAEFYGMMQKTLRKVDLASMENSLEVRVPFLKKSFIEASLKVSPWLSYGKGSKKKLLKRLLNNKLLGSPIDHQKKGFTVPLGHWMRKDLKGEFENRLMDRTFLDRMGLRETSVRNLFQQHQSGHDFKWPIFTLSALSEWQRRIHA